MKLSLRYKKSLSAISLVVLPWLVAVVPLSQVVLAQESGTSLGLVAQADRQAEADQLVDKGYELYDISQYQEALRIWEQALSIYREIKDLKGEGKSLNAFGNAYSSLGENQKAIDYYQQALAIRKQIGDRNGESSTLGNLGIAYYSLGKYEKAIEFHLQSLAIAKDIKNRQDEGTALGSLGNAYYALSKYEKAIDFYLQSLAIDKELKDRKGEGDSLSSLGNSYYSLDKYEKAIDFFLKSLAIAREIKDRNGEGDSLNNLGLANSSLGQNQKAIEYYQQSLDIFKQIKDRNGEGNSLNNLGVTYNVLGQYQKAIEYYQQSLDISKKIGDRNVEGLSLSNLGQTYNSLGQYQKAIEYYQQSLDIFKQINDHNGEGLALLRLGNGYASMRQYQKAIEYYQLSLILGKRIGDSNREGQSLNNLGNAYNALGNYQKAIDYHLNALTILEKNNDCHCKGSALSGLGNAYNALGNYQKAIEYYQLSLSLRKRIGDRDGEGSSLSGLGEVFTKLNQPELAILFFKQSVNVIESIRQDIRKLSKDEQKSYLDTVEKTYRNLADLLLKQDRILEAQQVLDLLKVQELSDYLRNVRGNSETAKGVDLQRPEQNIIALGLELADLQRRDPRTPEQEQRLASLTLQERDQNKQFNAFLQSPEVKKLIKELTLQEDRENIKVAEYNQLRKKLAQVKNAALFYPLILDDRLELILVTTTSPPIRKTINLKRTDLNKDILDFRESLSNPTSTTVQADAQKFYNYLIKPFESELKQARIETIIYAPDGQLRYIPLAALHDGKQWLIENYRVNNITASSLTNFAPRPYNVPKVFAAAATQSQTIQLDEQPNRSISFNPLPATKIEVEAIKTLIPKTEIFIDQKFDEKSTLEMQKYSIVHLATHGYFAVGDAEKSFLLYGDGKTASMTDIQGWSLTNVDLVILSACETAIGGKVGSGIEILGLGYQIQRAGAGASIASLWKVDDVGTQTLMQKLYESLKQKDTSLSEALRQAQIGMIRSDQLVSSSDRAAGIKIVGTVPKFPDGKLSHPYYWSAFILIGNGL